MTHKPHIYIVKLGFTGVYIIFLISAQKHRLWVLVRTASPCRGILTSTYNLCFVGDAVLTSTHNLCFEQKYEKYQSFLSEKKNPFLEVKFSIYLNRAWFRNDSRHLIRIFTEQNLDSRTFGQ